MEQRAAAKKEEEERKTQAVTARKADKEARGSARAERAAETAARVAARLAGGEAAEKRNLRALAVARQRRQANARPWAARRAAAKAQGDGSPSEKSR